MTSKDDSEPLLASLVAPCSARRSVATLVVIETVRTPVWSRSTGPKED
jgi:hypothetical protein